MKKTIIFITALALTALTLVTSCQKDSPEYRILTGEKVRFSIGSAGTGTKAVYSGATSGDGKIERIDWQKNDMIRIYCAAAREPECKYADYVVTENGIANATNPEISETEVEAVGGAGLYWGEGEHIFYAVYPSPEDEGSITTGISVSPYADGGTKSGISKSISGATVTAKLPTEQTVVGDITTSDADPTLQIAAPDLKNMLMTAKSDKYYAENGIGDDEIFLAFTPLTTAVQFTITNQTGGELKLKSVSLISASSALNGLFTVDINDVSHQPETVNLGKTTISYIHTYPYCRYYGTVSDVTKKVTIDFGKTVTLAYNADPALSGKLTFTFFLQPCQNFDDLTFKLTKSDDSWMSTRLGYTDGSGILFPRFMKTTVNGVFVPAGAQWTVKYGPEVQPWNTSDDPIKPLPEVGGTTVVTSWDTGVDDELPLIYVDPYNGHEYVDLGLPSGTLWATCNVGATKPEEYGKYFAWGDVTGLTPATTGTGAFAAKPFSWTNAPFNNGKSSYEQAEEYFASIKNTVCPGGTLALEYDAAHVNWGGSWRMPTTADFQELMENTTRKWIGNYNSTGISGYSFTNKNDSSKSIFLPAAGFSNTADLTQTTSNGHYWSSSLHESSFSNSYSLNVLNNNALHLSRSRQYGLTIRPVIAK